MGNQIVAFLLENIFVIGGMLLANCGFFFLGYCYSLVSREGTIEERIREAFKEGADEARHQSAQEKRVFSEDVTSELSKLRDGIINSARAYRDTLSVIENKVGFSSEDRDRLLIGKAVAADPTISLLDASLLDASLLDVAVSNDIGPSVSDSQDKNSIKRDFANDLDDVVGI